MKEILESLNTKDENNIQDVTINKEKTDSNSESEESSDSSIDDELNKLKQQQAAIKKFKELIDLGIIDKDSSFETVSKLLYIL